MTKVCDAHLVPLLLGLHSVNGAVVKFDTEGTCQFDTDTNPPDIKECGLPASFAVEGSAVPTATESATDSQTLSQYAKKDLTS